MEDANTGNYEGLYRARQCKGETRRNMIPWKCMYKESAATVQPMVIRMSRENIHAHPSAVGYWGARRSHHSRRETWKCQTLPAETECGTVEDAKMSPRDHPFSFLVVAQGEQRKQSQI